MRLSLGIAALAATFALASPAAAQTASTATAEARGTILQTLSLSRVEDLDFGTIAADDTLAGTVTIDADTGARSGSNVSLLPGLFHRAEFQAYGATNQVVTFALTQPAGGVLVNGANSITANLVLDQDPTLTRTVGASGVVTVYVGGTFGIAANQANGVYAADFDLTANFP